MPYTAIEFDIDGPVATITFNRPDKRNALNHALLGDLVDALEVVADDDALKVAVIRANGPAFSAGFDLDGSPYISLPEGEDSWNLVSGHKHQRKIRGLYEAIWDNPKVVIAQVHGHCLAGGMYLSMLCDLVVAADDAMIGEPFMRMGGASSMPFWSYLVGPRRANDMLFTGRVLSGKEAEEWGLVTRSVPADQLESTVREMAGSIAEAPLSGLLIKKEMWHTQADMLGWGAQFRYTTSLNSWLRMANPVPQEGESGMRTFMRERKQRQARGESTDY
ncbi:MAG: enoyl-CoA hydratase/isomerase family protein [Gammaproteobacteria bacterium]|nr:enoyl-CoA hydratase/isomerase family protein [Gammaproteobacteria bacterium]